mgnify:FL=1
MDKGCKKIVPLGKERDGQRLMTSFFKRLMQPQQDPKLLRQGGLRDASQPQGTGSRKQARVRLNRDLMENMVKVRALSQNSTDLLERQIEVSGVPVAILMCEGMVNLQLFTQILVRPLTELSLENADGEAVARWVSRETVLSGDQKEFFTYDELFSFLMAGFVVLLIDGVDRGIACGMQGYSFRSVSEPSTEMNITGSREGFVEPIRVNQTLIRRRLRSPSLKFEMYPIGEKSRTDICLVYLTDTADPRMVEEVKRRLGKLSSDILLSQGYLRPYLEGQPLSPFSSVGTTERPDTLCAKINEGRIGILVDGTPFALVVPYLFEEHFQSMDDYSYRPYYGSFIRLLKYFAFLLSIFLPGGYVAITSFSPEMLPDSLLFNIAASEQQTPFSMMTEALVIHLIYEIMREAGLRLPRPVGHAVSIIGALVIGDAAVKAGIIGSSMGMVVALTALSSFVVPSLYEPAAVLKFVFILVGGTWGLFGISVGFVLLLTNLCSLESLGVPVMAPLSPCAPVDLRDGLWRTGWKKLGSFRLRIQDLPGSGWKQQEQGGKEDE